MNLGSILSGIYHAITPWHDSGSVFSASSYMPRRKLPDDPGNQASNSTDQTDQNPNQFQQPNQPQIKTQTPENLFAGLNNNLRIPGSPNNNVQVVHNNDITSILKPQPGDVITPTTPKPAIPFWKRAVNDVGNVAGAAAGTSLGVLRAGEGLVQGAAGLPDLATHALTYVPRKLAGDDSAINRELSTANREVDTVTRKVDTPINWLAKKTDEAASAYGPGSQALYKPAQIGANVAAIVPGIIEGGSAIASKVSGVKDLSQSEGTLGLLGRAKNFVDVQRTSPLLTKLDALFGGNLSNSRFFNKLINTGEDVGPAASEATQIPVSQGISVDQPPSEPINIPVRNANTPGNLIQEVTGDSKVPTTNAEAAANAVNVRRVEAAAKVDTGLPDRAIEGVTPRAPEPSFVLNPKEVAAAQDKIVKDYADTLRNMGEGNGTQLVPDGEGGYTRTSNNFRTADTAGKNMTKAAWQDEARSQLESGKAEPGTQGAFNDVANPEVQATLAKGERPNVEPGRPITVQQAKGIPVTDQTNVPQGLPETPGTVRVTESTAPSNAKSEAVAAQTPTPIPKEVQAEITKAQTPQVVGVPTESPRGFVKTVAESDTAAAKTAAGIKPSDYTSLPNDTSFNTGDNFINEHGVTAAHKLVTDETAPFDAAKSGMGQRLMEHYANTDDTAKLSEVIDSMDRQARVSGQGIQMLSNWDKLSPEAVFKLANNEAEKAGVTLTDDFQKQILQEMKDVKNLPEGSAERAAAMQGVLKDISEQLPTTKKEWLQNYRYQNMLSSPLSAEKIGTSGAFNTLITHPVDLFSRAAIDTLHKGASVISGTPYDRSVAFSDIPSYYKNVLQGLPDAWQAAMESFKSGNLDKTFEEGKSGSSTIGQLRQQNIPLALRPFSAAHGAIYKFFQSLVAGGEQARLMEHGMSEAEAAAKAAELGDKLTLRSPLGTKEGAPAVRAVDAIGKLVSDVSKQDNALGSTMKWVAPFMKVSTNWAKLAVEHSPLALLDNPAAMTSEQVAKAFTGSVATGVGLTATMKGNVTLGAPTDSKEQALWYASGRKPYSVKIGDKWVDMRYLGPFAITFALPQAVKDATSGTNASKGTLVQVEKTVQNITKDIVSSTPLPSVAGFFNLLNGDSSVNPDKIMADLASQAIPLEALDRYIATVTDPIYRQSKTFADRIKSGIPGMSKDLPAFTTPEGVPETRNLSNEVAPYPIGVNNPEYSDPLKARQDVLAANAAVSDANKSGSVKGGQQVADNVWQLPDGTFSYKVGNEFKAAKTQSEAEKAIAQDSFNKSGKSYQVVGDAVFRRDAQGNVTSTPKIKFDYQTGQATLTKQKTAEDLSGWLKTAQGQLDSIDKQLKDPSIDPLDTLKLENDAQTLVNDMAKYKAYGGFTKPKGYGAAPKKLDTSFGQLKTSPFAPSVQKYATIATKSGSIPNITVQRPNIVHQITSSGGIR